MSSRFWMLVVIFLVAVIIASGIVVWSEYRPGQPVEVSLPPQAETQGEIYIGGAVSNPGIYPLKNGDSVGDIIRAAGGATDTADFNQLELRLPERGEIELPQKIDINRAEKWLLQALPGIGDVRAQAIMDYRRQNGPFHHISELTKVEGIGTTTYEQLEHLITVAD